MSKTAFIYPGQGAQKAGMGADFYENSEIARYIFDQAGEELGLDMKALCFEENDKLDLTEYTAEARRVLDGMNSRSARWYYLSSLANQGLGNSIDALQDARRAVQLDPNNTEYQMHLRRMQDPGQTYRTQTTYAQPGGLMRWCWSMILLNLLCNCCCGGGWGWRFRM